MNNDVSFKRAVGFPPGLAWLGMALAAGFAIAPAAGEVVDFETLPGGGTPFDGMVVSNQWQSLGVSFRFGNGTFPIIATPRGTNWAFFYPSNSGNTNTPAPGENIGRFFLADASSGQPPNLIIDYVTPVAAASGVIVDIDNQDAWTIEPRDANSNVISSAVVTRRHTDPNAGDGIATPWSVATGSSNIYSIRIRFTGTSPQPGLAFDNFSPSSPLPTPAPPGLSLSRLPVATSLTITGTPAALYRIQNTASLTQTNWVTWTNLYLPSTSATLLQERDSNSPARFYRALGIQ